MGQGPLCWMRNQCASVHAAHRCLHQASGGVGVTVWAGTSCQYRTFLHFVNGTKTCRYYLNNINDAAIGFLHEWHRPDHIVIDNNTPALQGHTYWRWGTSNGTAYIFSRQESHKKEKKPLWYQLSHHVEDHNPILQESTIIEYSTMITFCCNRQNRSINLKMQLFPLT